MIKTFIFALIAITLLAACYPVAAKPLAKTIEPTPPETNQPTFSTPRPNSVPPPGPTELFITQVMATKYAARTEYAALPTITPTPTIPSASPDCRPSDLQATFNTNGATGRIVLEVGITNIGNSACFLPAWPEVRLMDRSGKALDITYDYIYVNANPSNLPPTQESSPGMPIVYGMEQNQSAGLALLWGNWCGGAVKGGIVIRMYLLETGIWLDIATDIEGGGYCDDATSPSTLDVIGFAY